MAIGIKLKLAVRAAGFSLEPGQEGRIFVYKMPRKGLVDVSFKLYYLSFISLTAAFKFLETQHMYCQWEDLGSITTMNGNMGGVV